MIILRDKMFAVLFGDGAAMTAKEQLAQVQAQADKIMKNNSGLSRKEAMRLANDQIKNGVVDVNNAKLGADATGRNIRLGDKDYVNTMRESKGQYVKGKGANKYKKYLDKQDVIKPLDSGKSRRDIYNEAVARGREKAAKASEMARNNTTAAEAEKLGLFKRLKNGWNGMSTRNKVLVGGGAAALAAGGAYLAHKRRAKARASMED